MMPAYPAFPQSYFLLSTSVAGVGLHALLLLGYVVRFLYLVELRSAWLTVILGAFGISPLAVSFGLGRGVVGSSSNDECSSSAGSGGHVLLFEVVWLGKGCAWWWLRWTISGAGGHVGSTSCGCFLCFFFGSLLA